MGLASKDRYGLRINNVRVKITYVVLLTVLILVSSIQYPLQYRFESDFFNSPYLAYAAPAGQVTMKANRKWNTGSAIVAFLDDTTVVSPIKLNSDGTSRLDLNISSTFNAFTDQLLHLRTWNTTASGCVKVVLTTNSTVNPTYALNLANYTYAVNTITAFSQVSNETVTFSFAPATLGGNKIYWATISLSAASYSTSGNNNTLAFTTAGSGTFKVRSVQGQPLQVTFGGVDHPKEGEWTYDTTNKDVVVTSTSGAGTWNLIWGPRVITQSGTVAPTLSRVTSFLRSFLESITNSPLIQRVLSGLRGSPLSFSLALLTSRLNAFIRAPSDLLSFIVSLTKILFQTITTSIAVSPNVGRVDALIRLPSVTFSFTGLSARVLAFVRGMASWPNIAFSLTLFASRLNAFVRIISEAFNFAGLSSRINSFVRNSPLSLSLTLFASRLNAFARVVTVPVDVTLDVTREINAIIQKTITATINVAPHLARIQSLVRAPSSTIFSLSALLSTILLRTGTVSMILQTTLLHVFQLSRQNNIPFSLTQLISRLVPLVRSIIGGVTTIPTVDRTLSMLRSSSIGIVLIDLASRILNAQRLISVLISTLSSPSRIVSFLRQGIVTITTAITPDRLYASLRTAVQGMSISGPVSVVQALARSSGISSTFGINLARILSFIRSPSVGVSFIVGLTTVFLTTIISPIGVVPNVARVQALARGPSVAFSFAGLSGRVQGLVRSLLASLTIVASLIMGVMRTIAASIAVSPNVGRLESLARLSSVASSFTGLSGRVVGFLRGLSVAISLASLARIIWPRSVSLNIAVSTLASRAPLSLSRLALLLFTVSPTGDTSAILSIRTNRKWNTGSAIVAFLGVPNTYVNEPVALNVGGVSRLDVNIQSTFGTFAGDQLQWQVWNTTSSGRVKMVLAMNPTVNPTYALNLANYTYAVNTITAFNQVSNETVTFDFSPTSGNGHKLYWTTAPITAFSYTAGIVNSTLAFTTTDSGTFKVKVTKMPLAVKFGSTEETIGGQWAYDAVNKIVTITSTRGAGTWNLVWGPFWRTFILALIFVVSLGVPLVPITTIVVGPGPGGPGQSTITGPQPWVIKLPWGEPAIPVSTLTGFFIIIVMLISTFQLGRRSKREREKEEREARRMESRSYRNFLKESSPKL